MISKTKWGAVIAGLGGIAATIGNAIASGGPIPWGEVLPQIIAIIGVVVTIFGARDAIQANTDATRANRPLR
jgi:uncharacterized membrane protein